MIAVVELAAVVGLSMLPGGRLEPLRSSTYGLGLVVADAIRRGNHDRVGPGRKRVKRWRGRDGAALGARLLDANGHELPPEGGALAELAYLDLALLRTTLNGVTIIVASDGTTRQLGPRGAAAVFGPQKGARCTSRSPGTGLAALVSAGLERTGRDDAQRAGAGAAGGTGFAALALLNAEIKPGIELILDLIDFEHQIAGADLVVTGEGSLDEQSLAGKAPVGVARAAARAGNQWSSWAACSSSPVRLREAGIAAAYPLTALEPDVDRCIANAGPLLRRVGAQIARNWLS